VHSEGTGDRVRETVRILPFSAIDSVFW
jgi:hypothetical protein